MIFKKDGIASKKGTKTKAWWAKLAIAIILSNIFFFVLFADQDEVQTSTGLPQGQVEIQIKGELLTPFHSGKKVLLLQRKAGRSIEALLEKAEEGNFTVAVREDDASTILAYESWEIVPYLKSLTLHPIARGDSHEIRY